MNELQYMNWKQKKQSKCKCTVNVSQDVVQNGRNGYASLSKYH